MPRLWSSLKHTADGILLMQSFGFGISMLYFGGRKDAEFRWIARQVRRNGRGNHIEISLFAQISHRVTHEPTDSNASARPTYSMTVLTNKTRDICLGIVIPNPRCSHWSSPSVIVRVRPSLYILDRLYTQKQALRASLVLSNQEPEHREAFLS